MSTPFGFDGLLDRPDLIKLLFRVALDLVFVTVVIRFVYFRKHRNPDFVFTHYLFNVITLFLCLLLRKVQTELGLALALFGVFGILRYRTEQIRTRDLTYLFVVIGLGLINGVANKTLSLAELITVNVVIVGLVAALELRPWRHSESATPALYDRLDLLRPGNDAALLADLGARTGLPVCRIEINRVDLLRDAAEITMFHRVDRDARRSEGGPSRTPPEALEWPPEPRP